MKPFSFKVFTTREAYLLVAASMVTGLFVGLLFQGIIQNLDNNALLDRIALFFSELALLIPLLLVLKQRNLKIINLVPLKKVSHLTLAMSVMLIAGVIGLVSVFEVLVIPYFPLPDYLLQLEDDLYQGGVLANGVLILAAVIIAPVAEELLFRGLLQQSMFYHYGSMIPALVVPTVVFALTHFGYLFYIPALVELVALGLLLAWLVLKTGNLLIPILVHALFNLSAFSGLLMGGDTELETLADLGWVWIISSTVLFIAGWLYFKRLKQVVCDDVYLVPSAQDVGV